MSEEKDAKAEILSRLDRFKPLSEGDQKALLYIAASSMEELSAMPQTDAVRAQRATWAVVADVLTEPSELEKQINFSAGGLVLATARREMAALAKEAKS